MRRPAVPCLATCASSSSKAAVAQPWQSTESSCSCTGKVGQRNRTDLLSEERAEYGKQIISTVAAQLSAEYGRGFNRRNLYNMLRFAELFPDEAIVHALRTQLTWTHLREITAIDDPLKRQFYTEMCRVERWSTRTLKAKAGGMLYERTAIAKRPLRAIVAIELKLGRFDARDKGQMELYLRWLDKHERQPGENPPQGLILCSDKNQEQIELLELSEGTLRVASYLTELPPSDHGAKTPRPKWAPYPKANGPRTGSEKINLNPFGPIGPRYPPRPLRAFK